MCPTRNIYNASQTLAHPRPRLTTPFLRFVLASSSHFCNWLLFFSLRLFSFALHSTEHHLTVRIYRFTVFKIVRLQSAHLPWYNAAISSSLRDGPIRGQGPSFSSTGFEGRKVLLIHVRFSPHFFSAFFCTTLPNTSFDRAPKITLSHTTMPRKSSTSSHPVPAPAPSLSPSLVADMISRSAILS